ncbi:MAG: triose-phosphate isomerase [Helicobacteraceae bacterium]|jgi:triosephosphate isomerase|nr:triose-phosphate isomerase [Helicobacteraceae bacterium]
MQIVAANLKTNHTRNTVQSYLGAVESYIDKNEIAARSVVFPPMSALCQSREKITIGAQNAYAAENGSFTGEIGTEQLEEFAIKTLLIGHSERRHIFGENLELVKRKFDFFSLLDYEIFFCVGEPIEIKEAGFEVVMTYIEKQLDGIDLGYSRLVLAYEPVWAIGTGKTATTADITEVHNAIKEIADKPLLYGGSVKVENAAEIMSLPNVDGVLVGTTSWLSERYCQLLDAANGINK